MVYLYHYLFQLKNHDLVIGGPPVVLLLIIIFNVFLSDGDFLQTRTRIQENIQRQVLSENRIDKVGLRRKSSKQISPGGYLFVFSFISQRVVSKY